MLLPLPLSKDNKTRSYNLEIQLKEAGLMDEKGREIVPLLEHIDSYTSGYRQVEKHRLNDEYKSLDLTELDIAILLKFWFEWGELTLNGDIVTIEFFL